MRNKSKIIVGTAIILGFALMAIPVFAEDTITTTSPQTIGSNDSEHTLPNKFHCSTDTTGKQTCVENNSGTNPSHGNLKSVIQKLDATRIKERELHISAMGMHYQNEINRAQKTIDNLGNIIDRIKTQRTKLATTAQASDLAKLDALITQAESQQQDAINALADVKTKAAALKATLMTAKSNADAQMDVSVNDLTNLKQEIKDFQASVATLKTKLTILHKTLEQAVQLLKSMRKILVPPHSENNTNTNTNSTSTTNTAGGEGQH
jgi:DNA repair exonuclease SbcCD ATPase subunit